jgi:hypothetical protein
MSLYETEKKSGLATVAICILAALVLVGVGFGAYYSFTKDTIDKVSLCPSSGATGHFVVLIDNTSPFPFTQKAALAQRLKSLVANDIPQGALLTVFLLGEDYKHNSSPVFEKCNPGQWAEKNQWSNTKKFVDKDFHEKFEKPLDDVVRQIPLDVRAKTSPIFEMLQLAGINGFQHANVHGEKQLIIFSDMAANMPQFSMYKTALAPYKDFAKTPYGRDSVAPALSGATVTINMLAAEPTAASFTKRSEFWAQYFSENGASLERVNPMEGL